MKTSIYNNRFRFLLLLFLVVLISTKVSGKNEFRFADSTATWQMLVTTQTMFPPIVISNYTITYNVVGDSAVLGNNYQVIQTGNEKILLRRDSTEKVFYLDYQFNEHLLFDFSLEKGESFQIDEWASFALQVDSLDTVSLGGAKKRIILNCSTENCDEIWIDGIGNISFSWFRPFKRTVLFDGPSYELLCYSENDTTWYINPKYQTCSYNKDTLIYISVEEIEKTNIALYPNPVSEKLTIAGTELDGSYKLEIYDLSGRIITHRLIKHKESVSVKGLNHGIYFYQISSNQKLLQRGKIAIQ